MNIIKKIKLTQGTIIVSVIVISFLFAHYISPAIFIGETPRYNPQFIAKLLNFPKNLAFLVSSISNAVPNQSQSGSVSLKQLNDITLRTVTKGVYAGELGKVQYYKVSLSQIDWDQIELTTKSGNKIILRYPKGQPPAQEMLNIIKSQ